MTEGVNFDGDDLVDAVLGHTSATRPEEAKATAANPPPPLAKPTSSPQRSRKGRNLGWTLLWLLIVSVLLAVGIATRQPSSAEPPEPPICGGLFDPGCCAEWDENWGPCLPDDPTPWPEPEPDCEYGARPGGLFDDEPVPHPRCLED